MKSAKRLSKAEAAKRRIRSAIIIAVVILLLIAAAVIYFQQKVKEDYASSGSGEILSAQVETGASDGQTVEILSGLERGDEYYYRYADSVRYEFTAQR